MENGAISNKQISASSEWDANHTAIHGRLNLQATSAKGGSWVAATDDVSQWIQVDLGNQHTIVTRVATQGGNAQSQWVTKYKLQYSYDGFDFQFYREKRQNVDKVR